MKAIGSGRNGWQVSQHTASLIRPERPEAILRLKASPQDVVLDLNRAAIIVVDMQNDFCTPGGWLAGIGVDVTPLRRPVDTLNRLLPELRQRDVPVIWLNWGNRPDRLNLSPSILHVYDQTGDGGGIGEPLPVNGSRVLQQGGWGAAMVEELDIDESDIRVDKYRMSGFWDSPLDSILRNLRVDTVLFAGVNLDQCVMATLQDAVNCGYDAVLLADACATTSPSYCIEATYYNVKQCYGFVADAGTLIDALP